MFIPYKISLTKPQADSQDTDTVSSSAREIATRACEEAILPPIERTTSTQDIEEPEPEPEPETVAQSGMDGNSSCSAAVNQTAWQPPTVEVVPEQQTLSSAEGISDHTSVPNPFEDAVLPKEALNTNKASAVLWAANESRLHVNLPPNRPSPSNRAPVAAMDYQQDDIGTRGFQTDQYYGWFGTVAESSVAQSFRFEFKAIYSHSPLILYKTWVPTERVFPNTLMEFYSQLPFELREGTPKLTLSFAGHGPGWQDWLEYDNAQQYAVMKQCFKTKIANWVREHPKTSNFVFKITISPALENQYEAEKFLETSKLQFILE